MDVGPAGLPAPRLPRPPARDLSRRGGLLAPGARGSRCRATSRRCCLRSGRTSRRRSALAALLVGYCAFDLRRSRGARRRARRQALCGRDGAGVGARRQARWHGLCFRRRGRPAVAAGLPGNAVRDRSRPVGGPRSTSDQERVDVADLVVELGTARHGTLRAGLSRALGDPSLDVGYWFAEAGTFVAADGRPLGFPERAAPGSVTYVEHDGEPVAVLVQTGGAGGPRRPGGGRLGDRLAAANSRLQAEVRARVSEPRGIPTRGPGRQRRRAPAAGAPPARRGRASAARGVENLLRPHCRLALPQEPADDVARAEEQVAARPGGAACGWRGASTRGCCPRTGCERPCSPSSKASRHRSTSRSSRPAAAAGRGGGVLRVRRGAGQRRQVRAASRVRRLGRSPATPSSRVVVEDDGVGGADPSRGSGLRGLADRVATLGGHVRVDEAPGGGTRLAAEIPLGGEDPTFSRS